MTLYVIRTEATCYVTADSPEDAKAAWQNSEEFCYEPDSEGGILSIGEADVLSDEEIAELRRESDIEERQEFYAPQLIQLLEESLPWLSLLGDFIGNGVLQDQRNHQVPLGPMGRCLQIGRTRALLDAIQSGSWDSPNGAEACDHLFPAPLPLPPSA